MSLSYETRLEGRRKRVVLNGNPHPQKPKPCQEAKTQQPAVIESITYQKLWGELHTRQEPTAEWLTTFSNRVPCAACREHFRVLCIANQPRYDDWHRWTWEIHNAVNRKLNKPEFAWEDYAARWLSR